MRSQAISPVRIDARGACLALLLVSATLVGCYESSYDEAVDRFNAANPPSTPPPTTPPTTPPPTGSFGPNFSEIQTSVFTPDCATSGCHAGANPAANLNLDSTNSYMMLVGVASSQDAALQRVNPTNPDISYLIQKMEGTAGSGGTMPPNGALPQADIDVIRQWITAGAIDDRVVASTPIRVSSLSLTPNSTIDMGPAQITAGFDREVDASTINLNTFILEGSNNDGVFDDGDNIAITAASISVPAANVQSAVFDLTGVVLADDTYRIRLLGAGASMVMDLDANALDGEFSGTFPSGNGVEGGDFAAQFTVATPVVLGPTLDQIQAVIFTPNCATAGCHNSTTQAAGLSLVDADTSFLELVGQFSNQNGQSAVQLVEANNPDGSYLIRKMENAAGITGAQMPIGLPAIAQADIDQIRLWITNGALR